MKAKVEKPDINKLVNVLTCLNNLKTKTDDLYFGQLKAVPVDLKKLSYALSKDIVNKDKIQHTNYKSKQFRKGNL